MTANCGRDESPSGDAEALPEAETAKRIVEESISPKKSPEDAGETVEPEAAATGATGTRCNSVVVSPHT
jgi:hypothetical protein